MQQWVKNGWKDILSTQKDFGQFQVVDIQICYIIIMTFKWVFWKIKRKK